MRLRAAAALPPHPARRRRRRPICARTYLDALANPGPPMKVGAAVPASQPLGMPSVMNAFMAAHPSGGAKGAGGYDNSGFFQHLEQSEERVMADPGIGVGAGGMIASLFNPGLASSVAQHITPNPNPLAQQGQPGDGTVDSLGNPTQPNLAQPAVTQPDPANAANVAKLATPPDSSYACGLSCAISAWAELSDSFNRSIDGIAAGFGTAQQQASKQAALRGGDGTVGGGLGDLAGIQAMQDTDHRGQRTRALHGQRRRSSLNSLSQALGRPCRSPRSHR